MNSEQELISWKTAAWKDRNMVAGYAQSMANTSGHILMKNRVEVSAYVRNAEGKKILDIGIGTGRASLPLARAGYDVTGVDSSAAMLEKCRELAGPTPIRLLEGDVAALPFPDATFDTAMALNTISHFPHWKPILREWQRVVKPGGRLIFDIFSLDHDIAYSRATGHDEKYAVEHFAPKEAVAFYLRLKLADLLDYADEVGLAIVGIQPYSVLIGGSSFNRFLSNGPLAGKSWDRLLSWVAEDQNLFDFLAFLEEDFFGKLCASAGCRFFVVFENRADKAANERCRKRDEAITTAMQRGITLDTLDLAGIERKTFLSRLATFLEHAPNRFAFYRILMANLPWRLPVRIEDFIPSKWLAEAAAVMERATVDFDLTEFLLNFHKEGSLADAMTYRGVPLAAGFEYDLVIALLDGPVDAFSAPLDAPISKVPA